MPITRTIWVDDDGTGTTGTVINNAEKQQIYDQIDALHISSAMTWATFTPTSPAGLVFGFGLGEYVRVGPMRDNPNGYLVHFQINAIWPANTDQSPATILLPFVVKGAQGAGASQGYGVHRLWLMTIDTSSVSAYDPITNAPLNNQQMSGVQVVLSGAYITF